MSKTRRYSIIAGILLLIYSLYNLYVDILGLGYWLGHLSELLNVSELLPNIFSIFADAALCVVSSCLIFNKTNKLLFISFTIYVLINMYHCFESISIYTSWLLNLTYYGLDDSACVLYMLWLVASFIELIFNIMLITGIYIIVFKNHKFAVYLKKYCFLLVLPVLVYNILNIIANLKYITIPEIIPEIYNSIYEGIIPIIYCLYNILIYYFMCLWIKHKATDILNEPIPIINKRQPLFTQTNYQSDTDRLQAIKNLLDKGIISEEEFEKKKSEILGQ